MLDRLRSWPVHRIGFGVGVILALLVIGPGFGMGAWVNLDQTVLPKMAVPNSLFGLGPELPRRALFTTIPALFSFMGAAALVMKIIVVALFGFAVAGICRWLENCHALAAIGAGALYVLSPFVITRLAVGHLGLIWAAAFLPHALKAWLDPSVRWPKVFLYGVLMALGGQLAGGTVFLVLPAIFVARGFLNGFGSALWVCFAQLSWLTPGLAITAASGYSQPGAVDFPTKVGGWEGPFRLVAGEGFFNQGADAAVFSPPVSAFVGLVLCALAVIGVRSACREYGRARAAALVVVLVVGLGISMIATFEPGADLWAKATSNPVLNLWRESNRSFLVAWMPISVLVGLGIQRLARHARSFDLMTLAVPFALGLLLLSPNVWGVQDKLANLSLPDGWDQARTAIQQDPGTTLLLPAEQYVPVRWAARRTSHQLFGSYLGGDLMVSSDAGSGNGGSEIDPRMGALWTALLKWGFQPTGKMSQFLRPVGAKWVVVTQLRQGMSFVPLEDDRHLRLVVEAEDFRLYRVEGVTRAAGQGHPVLANEVWPGVVTVDTTKPVFLARSGAGGWLRGLDPGNRTAPGHLFFLGGGRIIWYWPALVTQIVHLLMALVVGVAIGTMRRSRVDTLVRVSDDS